MADVCFLRAPRIALEHKIRSGIRRLKDTACRGVVVELLVVHIELNIAGGRIVGSGNEVPFAGSKSESGARRHAKRSDSCDAKLHLAVVAGVVIQGKND